MCPWIPDNGQIFSNTLSTAGKGPDETGHLRYEAQVFEYTAQGAQMSAIVTQEIISFFLILFMIQKERKGGKNRG